MRTCKCVSTISYNTEQFLWDNLYKLVQNHVISDFMYIHHFREEDERKEHFHVWLKPNTLIDTMDIQQMFEEYDPNHPDKPLKCIDFRKSETDDWILYSIHDQDYLLSKGETRQYHYNKDDIRYYDEDTFLDLWYHALHGSKWAEKKQQINLLFEYDRNKADLIRQHRVPLQMASQLLALDNLQRTYRGYHENHEFQEEINKEIEMNNRMKETKE